MPQFAVHENLGRHRRRIPYVLVIQSDQFSDYRRRVVVPLVATDAVDTKNLASFLNPQLTVLGQRVVLHPLEIVSIPCSELGRLVTNLDRHSDTILNALDELTRRTNLT